MDVYEDLIRERAAGRPCALATIVAVQGSIPSHASAKMVVHEDGSIVGTVGGGPAEAEVILAAREVLTTGKPKMISFALHEDPRLDSGMVCGGSLDVYVEPIVPAPVVHLFGAGHVGLVTARMARLSGHDTVIVDDRPEFANAERFPDAKLILSGSFEESMARLTPDRRAMVVIATRCHELDGQVLRWALGTEAGYIGMIGSKRKILTVFARLQGEGVPAAAFERVHAPIGLDIGAETPEEIAVSVVAEMIAWRRGAAGVRPIMRNMATLAERSRHKEAS
ncbi:xanthine dehydrogenase [Siculibacillus lacustris]|uniref:Xanthine dehydrogenase n=1 Tax=Siculibacillus lacustris TaxID=1549641 RepID=A0A4Q9VL04_9HYPH|nr:XdhC/CoxI family protein [Siculibacillus lacustris]TBW36130.1 xanthine dehydrogenase [Siculibacillus lacustris]